MENHVVNPREAGDNHVSAVESNVDKVKGNAVDGRASWPGFAIASPYPPYLDGTASRIDPSLSPAASIDLANSKTLL
ncbi:hypothetical protein R1flu_007832 [Riccia fluitans]|uniref:Uncharacterized protein n=1 Tax=Riccia fluitans TaxID=41844 RepID=A0ABD1Z0T7_9MARC